MNPIGSQPGTRLLTQRVAVSTRSAATPEESATKDTVEVGEVTSPSSAGLGASASATAGQAAAGADFSKPAVLSLLQELEGQGHRFQRRGKFLFWLRPFDAARAEKAAGTLHQQQEGRVRVQPPNSELFLRVDDLDDLGELDAFYGSKNPDMTSDPHLAVAVKSLQEAGVTFLMNGRKVESYAAYNCLSDDPNWRSDALAFEYDDFRAELRSRDEALLADYLLGDGRGEGLKHKELARSMRTIAERGLNLPGENPVNIYRSLAEAEPGDPIYVRLGEFGLGERERRLLDDSQELVKELDRWSEIHQAVDGDRDLYKMVERGPTCRPWEQQAYLAGEVVKRGYPAEIYQQTLQLTDPDEDLDRHLQFVEQLREQVRPRDLAAAQAAVLSRGLDQGCYLRALKLLGEAELTSDFLTHLKTQKQSFEPSFERLEQLCQSAPQGCDQALSAFKALGEEPDLDYMKSLLADEYCARYRKSEELYQLGHHLDPEARQTLYSVWRAAPGSSSLSEDWKVISAAGPAALPERARLWRALKDSIARESAEEATSALQQISDEFSADQLTDMCELYLLNLKGHQGQPDAARSYWDTLKAADHPQLLGKIFAATNDLEQSHQLLQQAENLTGPAADLSIEQRVAPLPILARSFPEQELAPAYEFLTSRHQPQESLETRARLFAQARAKTGDVHRARTALSAYQQSPHAANPEAGELLADLLRLDGQLHHVRPLWESLLTLEARPDNLDQHIEVVAELDIEDQSKLALAGSLAQHPLAEPEALAQVSRECFKEESLPKFLALLESEKTAAERQAALTGFTQVFEAIGKDSEAALEIWPELRPFLDGDEFEDVLRLKTLRQGSERVELTRKVLNSRRPQEQLKDLGEVARHVGLQGFDDWRAYLEKGNPEGGELIENTAFMAKLIDYGADPENVFAVAFAPVKDEPTQIRREILTWLVERFDDGDVAVKVWKSLSSHTDPRDEDFLEGVEAYEELRQKFSADDALEFIALARQIQKTNPDFTLTEAQQKAAPLILEGASLAQIKEAMVVRQEEVELDVDLVTVGDHSVARS